MASFWCQYKALLWRNIQLKRRNKGQLAQELLYPVYFVAILAGVKLGTNPSTKPALKFPTYDIHSFGVTFTSDQKILVSPDTPEVSGWMQTVSSQLPGSPTYQMFSKYEDAETEYRLNDSSVAAGIMFYMDGYKYSYAIRIQHGSVPDYNDYFDRNKGACRSDPSGRSDGDCRVNSYLHSGFVELQLAIENTLLMDAGVTSVNVTDRDIRVHMMDKGEYKPDTSVIQTMSSIYFVFALMFIANFLSVNLVTEKEKKIREGMQMMGLRDSALWLSWASLYLAVVMVAAAAMVIIIVASKFFERSNIFLLYLIIVLYGMSIIAFAFMITPFFKKAKTAGGLTGFITVIFSCIYLAISQTRSEGSYNSSVPPVAQWFMCLLSPVAFAACMDQGIYLDVKMDGFGFDDSLTYGEFPLIAPIVMLIVDILLYSFLTIYLDHVIPGEYGVRYSPFYLFQPSYWCPRDLSEGSLSSQTFHRNLSVQEDIEEVPPALRNNVSIRISSLTKSYKVEKKMKNVVDDFNLDIYSSQITCLLGHNGAGKTTLMNMLTGVVPPTSGHATVMGLNITNSSDMEQIRQWCGICPQHNILQDLLSCREHLEMFAAIKGVPDSDIDAAVRQALKDVDLEDQMETFSVDLSGGQKRKLSVAIALIGDPKLIFLDEPTAGMDPYSRRHLWGLLKKKKEGRTVLLTTHFMDEADILADRKAFIRKGKLRCCGSSLFLKNKFGIGYHLTMVAEPDCDVERVTTALQAIVPSVQHQRTHGKEVSYTVPLSEVGHFSELFGNLDQQASSLKIKNYGVSMTTLEEIFLKLEEDHEEEDGHHGFVNGGFDSAKQEDVTIDFDQEQPFLKSSIKGSTLWKQRFWTLFKLRFLLTLRSGVALFFQVVFPVAFVVAGLFILKNSSSTGLKSSDPLWLEPSLYANTSTSSHLPNFLVFDAVNSNDSQAVISDLENRVTVDTYNPLAVNTSDVALHFIGLQLDNFFTQAPQYLSSFVTLYNDEALHSVPVLVSMATQNLMDTAATGQQVNGFNWPWPQLSTDLKFDGGIMGYVMLIGLAFVLVIPGFSSEVVRDREHKLRSQLRISGLDFNLYWGTIYLTNLIVYLFPAVLMLICILAMQIDGLNNSGSIAALCLMMLTNIPFNIVMGLVLSFIFDKADTCVAYLPTILNFLGLLPYITVMMVDTLAEPDAASAMHTIFCFIDPIYIMFGGFYYIARVHTFAGYSGGSVTMSDYFSFEIVLTIIAPLIHFVWMYWLLRVLDIRTTGGSVMEAFPCWAKSKSSVATTNNDMIEDEDDDVKKERTRIENMSSLDEPRYSSQHGNIQTNDKNEVGYVLNLRKIFNKRTKKATKGFCKPRPVKTKVAVRNLSFGVHPGEVFGLLGPNGAGKSTALNMMIAETAPTCGKVIINGHNIRSNMLSLLNSLGYCPQHDALWETITLKEHIKCFAAIKGISPQNIESTVNYYISSLKLEEHKNKKSKKLSGGTKRKLSYILSILGSPQFVLMDEPSTGMDPQSKRFLWDTISHTFSDSERGAILTTHYMEEADALCSRIGIMINGQLECLGSNQHLKSKFGSGYILEVKLGSCEADQMDSLMDSLEEHLKSLFPDMERVERFMERAQYSIPKGNVTSLGETFASLEQCKSTHNIEEYSFSQSTLEQVFLYFAKQQMDETKDEDLELKQNSQPSLHRLTSKVDVDASVAV